MKKYTIALLLCLQTAVLFAQSPEKNNLVPTIVRPSPTVSQLMKMEESQLDHYTGQPGISIPLYSAKSGNMNVDLTLTYNSSGIRVKEQSGWVGKGWSLQAGGVVSRTVIDLPDEINTATHKGANYNDYHNFFTYAAGSEERKTFAYDAQWGTRVDLDSKNDIYQFSFFGKTGRFVFTKVANVLQPVIVGNDCNYKITCDYVTTGNAFYPTEIASFTIIDDNGYKYYFTEKERTEKKDVTFMLMQAGCNDPIAPINSPGIGKFISAWQLSKVEDENGIQLLGITYSDVLEKPNFPSSYTSYTAQNLGSVYSASYPDCTPSMICALKPQTVTNQPVRDVDSKKISRITLKDGSYIQFSLSATHPEYREQKGCQLTGFAVYDGKNVQALKTFDLSYINSVFLKEIKINNSAQFKYAFEYYNKDLYPVFDSYQIDFSGYPLIDSDKESIATGALTKIVYPTKGVREFTWEPNTYSYKGDKLLTFQEIFANPDNYTTHNEGHNDPFINDSNVTIRPYQIIQVNFEQDAMVYSSTQTTGLFEFEIPNTVKIIPIQSASNQAVDATRPDLSYPINNNETINKTMHLKPGFYKVYFHSLNVTSSNTEQISASILMKIKEAAPHLNWFAYGGGIRVKSVKDLDKGQTQLHKEFAYNFENPNIVPVDKPPYLINVTGDYTFSFSSGSMDGLDCLSNKYFVSIASIYNVPYTDWTSPIIDYLVEERQSELNVQLQKGSLIGYKNVFEYEYPNVADLNMIYKSKIKYTFDSPIDFPSIVLSGYSVLPIRSWEYKQSNVRKIEYFNAVNSPVLSEEFKYNYDLADIRLFVKNNFYYHADESRIPPVAQQIKMLFRSYADLKSNFISAAQYAVDCTGSPSALAQSFLNLDKSLYYDDLTKWVISAEDYRFKPQVTEHLKKEYLTSGVVTTKDEFVYKDEYKLLSEKTTYLQQNKTVVSKYFYPKDTAMDNELFVGDLRTRNLVGKPLDVQFFSNGTKISEQKTIYKKWGTTVLAPEVIQTAKLSHPLETQVRYSSYDDHGNPVEVRQENGTKITYLWGYNKTQPIAKIENASYTEVQAQEANLQSLSNTGTEANLIMALNSLRSSLPNAMVTTYTYKPLLGISTVTDPKGFKTVYEYDAFNRLFQIKDQDGNVLSKNEYNYRPN